MPKSLKKLRSNQAWIQRHINDPFVKKSRQEGYRARSVYKLTELDDREHLFKPGMTVVDLGSAPGSWTQIVRERLSNPDGTLNGRIIAIVSEGDQEVKALASWVIEIPETLETLVPLLSVIPLQLIAYHVAVVKGLNVDQPRNLAKSVTVE
jgi:23S rRNA U2552 (ribose-2'-O)-methylase RlmE/FtsJ